MNAIWAGHPGSWALEDFAMGKMFEDHDAVATHVEECHNCLKFVDQWRREKLAELRRLAHRSEDDVAEEEFRTAIQNRKFAEQLSQIRQRLHFESDPLVRPRRPRRPAMIRPGQLWRVARKVQSEVGNTYLAHEAQPFALVLSGREHPSHRFAQIRVIPVNDIGINLASYGDWIFSFPGHDNNYMLAEVWNHTSAMVGHLEKYFGRIAKAALEQIQMLAEITDRGGEIPPDLLAASAVLEHSDGWEDEYTVDFRRKEAEMAAHFWRPTADIPCPDGPDDDGTDDPDE